MRQSEESIKTIKHTIAEMWNLVESQLIKAEEALLTNNKDLAAEILSREKMVDAYELSIDRECENFFALLTPVAIDLRLILSVIKINNNLERIGDFAAGIAQFTLHDQKSSITQPMIESLRLKTMFDEAILMLQLCKIALVNESSSTASKVFAKDNILDEINRDAVSVLADLIVNQHMDAQQMLHLYAVIRRVERIGDRCSNIAEEIVFYVDAKILKHSNEPK